MRWSFATCSLPSYLPTSPTDSVVLSLETTCDVILLPYSFYITYPFSNPNYLSSHSLVRYEETLRVSVFSSFLFTFRREREGMVEVLKARQGKAGCKAASFVYLD